MKKKTEQYPLSLDSRSINVTVVLWIFVGLLAGAGVSVMSREHQSRFTLEVVIGLVCSIVGGLLAILLKSQ